MKVVHSASHSSRILKQKLVYQKVVTFCQKSVWQRFDVRRGRIELRDVKSGRKKSQSANSKMVAAWLGGKLASCSRQAAKAGFLVAFAAKQLRPAEGK